MMNRSGLTRRTVLVIGLATASGMPHVQGAADSKPDVDVDTVLACLSQIITDTADPEVKWRAVRALGAIRYPRATPLLIECLSDEHPYVRANAARSLGEMRAGDAVEPLIQLLRKEKDGGVIQQTSLALNLLRAREAIPALKNAAVHPNFQTRMWVLQAIGELGSPKDVPFLARFLNDSISDVQYMAAKSIEKIVGVDFGFPKHHGIVSWGPGIQSAKTWWAENRATFEKAENQDKP